MADVSLAGDVVERITTENLLDQFAGDGLERDGDGLAIADDAVGPDQMDPDSATEGQGHDDRVRGCARPGQFPFEFPRTRSTRTQGYDGGTYALISTIERGVAGEDISISSTFTIRRISGHGSGSVCQVGFESIGTDARSGQTSVLGPGQTGPLTMTLTATNTTGSEAGSEAIALTAIDVPGTNDCQIDSGATLTLSTT